MTKVEFARFLKDLEYGITMFDFKSTSPDTELFLVFTEPSDLDMSPEIKELRAWLRRLDMDVDTES